MKNKRKLIHRFFEIGIILKAINAGLEMIGGVVLLFIDTAAISQQLTDFTTVELSEDKNDFLANALVHLSHSLSTSSKIFGAFYLLSHGIVKIGLVVGLVKKKLWAYPACILFLIIFILYQLYRLSLSLSIGMTLLTALDVVLVWLVWSEFQYVKS